MPAATAQPMANGHTTSGNNTNGHTPYKLGNFSIDEARPMKVVAIGAGYSGEP